MPTTYDSQLDYLLWLGWLMELYARAKNILKCGYWFHIWFGLKATIFPLVCPLKIKRNS